MIRTIPQEVFKHILRYKDPLTFLHCLQNRIELLNRPGLVQIPEAVDKLYALKGRHPEKPISICLPEVADLRLWANVSTGIDLSSIHYSLWFQDTN